MECRTSTRSTNTTPLFLQGWVQAQDRLFQIDVLRRQAGGTLAELVGPSARARATSNFARSVSRAARAVDGGTIRRRPVPGFRPTRMA